MSIEISNFSVIKRRQTGVKDNLLVIWSRFSFDLSHKFAPLLVKVNASGIVNGQTNTLKTANGKYNYFSDHYPFNFVHSALYDCDFMEVVKGVGTLVNWPLTLFLVL